MTEENLAPEVLHFIGLCIPSVPHLEALLLIWETVPRAWTAGEIAARIYIDDDRAGEILKDLERCGMVARDAAQPMSFKYDPHSDWDHTLPLVSQTYRRQLSRVARHIHAQGPKPVREFSRAFRLRREQ
jgi:hypothetical protein